MLLGIKDDGQDYLLSFLIDDMENLINSYCHTAEVPTKLQSLVPQMAAEMYRRKGYGQTAAPQVIKSVTEDKRSVSFETSSASTAAAASFWTATPPISPGSPAGASAGRRQRPSKAAPPPTVLSGRA